MERTVLVCLAALLLASFPSPAAPQQAPFVYYTTQYVSHNRPQGPPMCQGVTTITVNTVVYTKTNSPNLVSIVYRLDPHTTLLENTTKINLDPVSLRNDPENGLITMVVGELNSNTKTTITLSFDVTVEEFYGILFLQDVRVNTFVDQWPVYPSDLPPVYFDCQDNFVTLPAGDDDLDDGEIAAVVILSVFGFLLLLLLLFLAVGRGGSQTFTGAGPSQWRENPDG